MAKVTINVPDDLKHRMERHGEINWSQVARRAFEQEMDRREVEAAAAQVRDLRAESRAPNWSGAKEIRRWRDGSRQS